MNLKVRIENVGVIRSADMQLGGLTVLCGKNNSGKTYVTHSIFGILNRLQRVAGAPILEKIIIPAEKEGVFELPESEFFAILQESVDRVSSDVPSVLSDVLASDKERFANSKISLKILMEKEISAAKMSFSTPVGNMSFNVSRVSSGMCRVIYSWVENVDSVDTEAIKDIDVYRRITRRQCAARLQANYLPRVFICSAERTGAGIFQKELDFTRSRLIDLMSKKRVSKIDPYDMVDKFVAEYPMAVRKDVDFMRNLSVLTKRSGKWAIEHGEILKTFSSIVGGDYVAQDGDMRFVPSAPISDVKALKLSESSSSVRAMLDMAGYLKHIIQSGDLLIIDEPEMNLHPESQRKVARLFATLVNTGVNVFITTHSDYLMRELNLLILLKGNMTRSRKLAEKYGYLPLQLLDASNLHVYQTEEDPVGMGLKKVSEISVSQDGGIASSVFDDTINEMNRISDDIYWGE